MATNKQPNRDTVTSINRDGSRFNIHPADVKGFFTRWRRIFALALIGIYVLLPWIPINGHPAVFLDVINRRFHLFGITLAAQDTWLIFFFLSGLAFFLFYITAFLGRVWCGWACPQTVFLDHVYRRIERWIEGDAVSRRKLDKAPWNEIKILKRITKHTLFLIVSGLIAHVFISYFISIPQLWSWMQASPLEHWSLFLFVSIVTGALYLNFAWFREQLCIVICPYGRFQSALLDDNSLNVAYDYQRGDPPGSVRDEEAGDCIDCHRCIQVCPTGIDIRQGLQLECIGCTACIDACDTIMDKVKRPRGLIRYASDNELSGIKTQWIRPRTIMYTVLLFIGVAVAASAFSRVNNFVATIARMPGAPFYVSENVVRNQYQIRLVNKSDSPSQFSIDTSSLNDQPFKTSGFDESMTLAPLEEKNATFVVQVPKEDYNGNFHLRFKINSDTSDETIDRTIEFIGPDPKLFK